MVRAQPITKYSEGVSIIKSTTSLFSQILQVVPPNSFLRLDHECGAERHAKGFSSWDQYVAMLFCQLAQAIERELRKFSSLLISVPGLGPVFVADIMAEVQGIHRFPDHPATAKLWPVLEHKRVRIIPGRGNFAGKTGNSYLRYYLIEAANSVRMHDAEYARYYRTKYDESSKHELQRQWLQYAPTVRATAITFAPASAGQEQSPYQYPFPLRLLSPPCL